MKTFEVLTDNSEYRIRTDLTDLAVNAEAALAIGIRGGIAIVGDEIEQGKRSASVEIRIQDGDGLQHSRSIVTVSVSTLIERG